MLRAVTATVRGDDMDSYLRYIVEAARELVAACYAAIAILGKDERIDRFIPTGMSEDDVKKIGRLPVGLGVMKAVIQSREPIRLREISQHGFRRIPGTSSSHAISAWRAHEVRWRNLWHSLPRGQDRR
jgi:two-component system sensor histidine kinase DevS